MKRDMAITSQDTSENMFSGNELYQQRARVALPILVECAKARKTITYEELGAAVGMRDLRSIERVCGSIEKTLADFQKYLDENTVPRITNLVIRNDGRPGAWVCEQLTGDREKAPPQEEYDALLERIYNYLWWDTVLGELDLFDFR